MEQTKEDLAIAAVMLAGKLMIENGADMARVDDALYRIARNAGISDPKIFETTTGIMMSIPSSHNAQVQPIQRRFGIDLEKIARVNDASRAFQAQKITLAELYSRLQAIDEKVSFFAFRWQVLGAALVSSTLQVLYGGSWFDFLPTFVIGAVGYAVYYWVNIKLKLKFVSEFLGSVVLAFMALLAVKYHLGINADMIVIGAIMPLVPGVPLTNAVRDILAGHILSGIARATEAFLSACAISMGVGIILRFW